MFHCSIGYYTKNTHWAGKETFAHCWRAVLGYKGRGLSLLILTVTSSYLHQCCKHAEISEFINTGGRLATTSLHIPLTELFRPYIPSRSFRAGSVRPSNNLKVVNPRTKTYGERAFTVAAPVLWNAIPPYIRNLPTIAQFKGQLKTHLFSIAYSV